ncbi:uncharacterized protein LOC129767148 [Toxorhynchites rutilus septentrionalis]|uniref:uncharacterized protein LOC129767148 n=1 Tax=Toxorhynchites rutilus septentrionalis TaxID=329112 RepID=UPI0024798256|nr:uncharacterized protein LOC129767148 [Toxorhynchites rutilus septentrionalis]
MIAKVRATPAPKPDRLEILVSFGLVVQNLCGHLKAVGLQNHLANPILLQELVDKLPATIKFSWALYQEQVPVVDLNVFSAYMAKISSAASGVTQHTTITSKMNKDERIRQKERSYLNTHVSMDQWKPNRKNEEVTSDNGSRRQKESGTGTAGSKFCFVCKVDSHQVESCASFKGLNLYGRWKAVKVNKLCARCLTSHARWPCKEEICGINDCPKRHHRLLHFDPPTAFKNTDAVVAVHRQLSSSTLFRILPVTLFGKNGQFNTYAFLDDGSSVTLVERSIANALGVSGEMETLHIEWTGGINKTIAGAEVVTMEISEAGGSKRYKLSEVYTVDNLGLPQQTTDYAELAARYTHLEKLPVKSFKSAIPGILIGQSNCHLLATLKLREGKLNEPVATKTRIGWAVCGSLRSSQTSDVHKQLHMYAVPTTVDLHEYVQRFFDIESLGVAVVPAVKGAEKDRAYKILKETTRRTSSGKFEIGLIWRYDYIEFPDNRPMAERRFRCLEKRLARNPELYDSVRQQIVDGVSLNSILLKGPDLLTPLLSVLFPYREREVAVSADVREMFLQMLVRAQDRSALLFPYGDSPELPLKTMVSNVAIFGAACSPSHSQYVKNLNATEQEAELPRGAAAVKKRHYVDDYVDSFDTAGEDFKVTQEVIEVHKRAGFHIRNWMSNDRSVLEKLGEENLKSSKPMLPEKDIGFERVLGMAWIQEKDVFVFSLQFCEKMRTLLEGTVIPTKREMLRLVMNIYDPLGLVASFVIHGKILIQEVWRTDTDWDSNIPMEIATRWMEWLATLRNMTGLRIPRCYFPGYDPESFDSLELHVFVDASAQAYAAVAYFRISDRRQIRVALVASKTKVAPLRGVSIPRLELMAALLGARLRKTIEENHSIKVKKTCFWSDSSTKIKSEILNELKSELRMNFTALINSNSLTPKSSTCPAYTAGSIRSRRLFPEQKATERQQNDLMHGTASSLSPSFDNFAAPAPKQKFWLYLSRISCNVTVELVHELTIQRLGTNDIEVFRLVAKGKDVSSMSFI